MMESADIGVLKTLAARRTSSNLVVGTPIFVFASICVR